MKRLIFTYGTLMKGQCRNSVLDNSKYVCDAILDDYGIYETGSYPAAVPVKGFRVYGEVYEIDDSLKPLLDQIEGEGSLYEYKEVLVHDKDNREYKVGFYEYLLSTEDLPLRLPDGKWTILRQDISNNYAWYACYGSNLCQERFDLYLRDIDGKAYAQRKYIFDNKIYFARKAPNWFSQGVCFLDLREKGKSYGWMYLIKQEDVIKLSIEEGSNWYPIQDLGKDDFGIDIKTVTLKDRIDPYNKASEDYYTIIAKGLQDRYNLTINQINEYLETSIEYDLSKEHIKKILDEYEKRKHIKR